MVLALAIPSICLYKHHTNAIVFLGRYFVNFILDDLGMSAKLSWYTICILIFTFAFSSMAENKATFEASVQRYRTRINKDPENLDLHREMIDYTVELNKKT